MTAAERLLALAGTTGTAAALLLAIGTGATAGAALVDYSGLASATAAEHLLVDAAPTQPITGGKPRRRPTINKPIDFQPEIDRRRREEEALLLTGLA